jgi:rubredoxin
MRKVGRKRPADVLNDRGRKKIMERYVCGICGYVYDPAVGDPEAGIRKGVSFEDLPEDWVCPVCGAGKDEFSPE